MSNKLQMKQGQSLTTEERMVYLLDLRDMMERGYMSLTKIQQELNISRPTAIEWRKAALVLMDKDTNGFTRESIRNLQIGRIQYMIERLQMQLDTAEDKDKLAIHDRIVKYYDSLSRITGLNSEQIQHTHELKPLVIQRATPVSTDNK